MKSDWKLIRLYADGPNQESRYELYNLTEDIGEKTNLAEKHPKKVKQLDILINRFLKETDAVIPKPNPAYNPNAKPPAKTRKKPPNRKT